MSDHKAISLRRRKMLLVVTILVAASVWISPWQRELAVGDETKYSRVIHSMRESGSLLVLSIDDQLYTHKPPIHFWLILGLIPIFGFQSLWSFVLPSLVSFLLLLVVTHRFSSRIFGQKRLVAVFILSTFWLSWGLAQTARMDHLFVLLISLGALAMFRHFREGGAARLDLVALWLGVATLVKGPMAPVIGLGLFTFESIRRRRRPRIRDLVSLVIALAIPLVWLVPATLAGGREYADQLLVKQSLGRAIGAWVHSEPPWFYLAHFPGTFFPWFFLVLLAIVASLRANESTGPLDGARFCVSWFAAVLVPYSVISSKLDVYMLPAMVPASLLIAFLFDEGRTERLDRLTLIGNRLVAGFLFLLAGALLIAGFLMKGPEVELLRHSDLRLIFTVTFAAGLIGLVAQLKWAPHPTGSSVVLGIVAMVPLLAVVTVGMPLLNREASTQPLVEVLRGLRVEGSDIALYSTPHLWSRNMPDSFAEARVVSENALREGTRPEVIVAREKRAAQLGPELTGHYQQVARVRMIGKEFHVYRYRRSD
ncbi:MAG TPA: glycosyltransferase family 39 protein [Thermoanaerobaculia bacterium]|nr:glycosyltransferase family 39 protein [Thermoanaerobaculia bacterium]